MVTDDRHVRRTIPLYALLAASVLLASSCSVGPEPTYRVQGIVTLNGEPLEGGTVLFELAEPSPRGKRYTARATINDVGFYELSTFGNGDGAVAGQHRVIVFGRRAKMVDSPYMPGNSVIPSKYNSPETTDLRFEVLPGENRIDIPLQPDPPTH